MVSLELLAEACVLLADTCVLRSERVDSHIVTCVLPTGPGRRLYSFVALIVVHRELVTSSGQARRGCSLSLLPLALAASAGCRRCYGAPHAL